MDRAALEQVGDATVTGQGHSDFVYVHVYVYD